MKRLTTILAALCLALTSITAQELSCTVTINSEQIQGSNKSIFQTLQQSITEFLNQTKWTPLTYSTQEKIECSMMILVNKIESNGLMMCEMTLQSRRPVYGSTYTTPILNYRDKNFDFVYNEYDRLDYLEPTQLTSNLTALLAFYAYLIIGHDCDSYEKMGGQPFFLRCEEIVNAAQSASFDGAELEGWKAFKSNRNRYGIINNLLDESFRKYRELYYTYHRLCLDEMTNNVSNARARIANELPLLREAVRSRPATFVVNTFLDAKADELTNIFMKGTAAEKKQVYQVLFDIDPTREDLYSKINEKQ